MDVSDVKIRSIQDATSKCQSFVEDLCDIRKDIYEIKSESWLSEVSKIREEIQSEQMLLFIGPYSSGKSTFINSLLGENILPTSSQACTSVITELTFVADGNGSRGKIFFKDERMEEGLYDQLIKIIDGPTGAIGRVAQIHHIELVYDLESLKKGPNGYDWEEYPTLVAMKNLNVKLVDCPGYGSPYTTNEDLINEYISRASFTFWLSPADKLGGAAAAMQLTQIKKKTTTLIPVITMSDKIDDQQKEQVIDDFQENIGQLFQYKEPRFISSLFYREAMELQKKLSKDKKIEDIERHDIESKIHKYVMDSGMERVAEDLICSGGKKIVTENKVKSALYSLNSLFEIIKKSAREESKYWENYLNNKGWTPTDDYKCLTLAKEDNEKWIKREAKSVGNELETALLSKLSSYMMKVKKNIKTNEILDIVSDTQKKIIDDKIDSWGERLVKAYANDKLQDYNIKKISITPPTGITIADSIRNTLMGVLDSVKYAGIGSVVTGSLGAVVMINGGTLPWIGSLAGPIGIGLMAVALVPLIPAIYNAINSQNEEYKKNLENQLNIWLRTLNIAPLIEQELNKENNGLYNLARQNMSIYIKQPIDNYEAAKIIIEGVNELQSNIRQQFEGVK